MRLRKLQSGVALATAIIVLLILAVLGVYIMRLSIDQQASVAMDVMESNAFYAARAGSEWGTYQALKNTATPCAAKTSFAIDGMTVTVSCQQAAAAGTELGSNPIYLIHSTACNIPDGLNGCPGDTSSPSYVEHEERRVGMLVEKKP